MKLSVSKRLIKCLIAVLCVTVFSLFCLSTVSTFSFLSKNILSNADSAQMYSVEQVNGYYNFKFSSVLTTDSSIYTSSGSYLDSTYRKNYTKGVRYSVEDVDSWNNFAMSVRNGCTFEGKTVYLDADIKGDDYARMFPVGSGYEQKSGVSVSRYRYPFKGDFDGQNHMINGGYYYEYDGELEYNSSHARLHVSNIWYASSSWYYTYYSGLFGYIENGSVKNLKVTNIVIETAIGGAAAGYSNNFFGTICGYLKGGTIENCLVEEVMVINVEVLTILGSASKTEDYAEPYFYSTTDINNNGVGGSYPIYLFVGGIVGYNAGTVLNCEVSKFCANISQYSQSFLKYSSAGFQQAFWIGGIAGATEESTGAIKYCTFNPTLSWIAGDVTNSTDNNDKYNYKFIDNESTMSSNFSKFENMGYGHGTPSWIAWWQVSLKRKSSTKVGSSYPEKTFTLGEPYRRYQGYLRYAPVDTYLIPSKVNDDVLNNSTSVGCVYSNSTKTNVNQMDSNIWFSTTGFNDGYPSLKSFLQQEKYTVVSANSSMGTVSTSSFSWIKGLTLPYDLTSAKVIQQNNLIVEATANKGYKFKNWTYDSSTKTFTANFEENKVVLTAYLTGKTNGVVSCAVSYKGSSYNLSATSRTISILSQDSFVLNINIKNGYKVDKVTLNSVSQKIGPAETLVMTEENATLIVNISLEDYVIYYTLNNGTLPEGKTNPQTYTVETATFTLANPTRLGYEFLGWSGTNISGTSKTVSIPQGSTGNRTYTANWQKITYKISYDLDGGSVSGNPAEYTVEDLPITLINPEKTGYVFNGWTGSNGTTPATNYSIANGTTGDLSFKANWTANKYIIDFSVASYSDKIISPTIKLNGQTQSGSVLTVEYNTEISYTRDTVNNIYTIKVGDYEVIYDLSSSENRKFTIEEKYFGLSTYVSSGKLQPDLPNNSNIKISPRVTYKTYVIGGN